ncbi:UPF0496 protein At3g19330-like [Macadamia integrifolia]|uniref:UPF0496 protein At3g19330-like n=1 Tax=Macadamia integrifolia TaxID=60698 RepID=UPI001C501A8B|nr:UPF0496 protein At3g19330-like [Macadamia integrifolia]
MHRCFALKSTAAALATVNSPSSTPSVQGTETTESSREETPESSWSRSTTHFSPTFDLTREYTFALQTNSYKEIWSKIHQIHHHSGDLSTPDLLSQLLQPNRSSVEEALRDATPGNLTRLACAYFDYSEHTSNLCLRLHRIIDCARSMYAPVHELLEQLPLDFDFITQTQQQCDWAFDVLLQFESLDNPFPNPDSNSNSFNDMRRCLAQMKLELDLHLHRSRKKIRLFRGATTSSALCLIGLTVGVAATAVGIAAHALAVVVAGPLFAFLPIHFTKRELHHIAQLEAAAKGTYVINNDLDTIDRLVARLHAAVESDKLLIRLGVVRGRDKYPIQEVVKQLRKNQPNLLHQLRDLEEHLCLCCATVNRARSLLVREIHLQQTRNS